MGSRVWARIGLVVMGLALAVVLLELALQLGALFVGDVGGASSISWQTNDRRFLALGDSNTYGVWLGERDQEAYPAQLERVWNAAGEPRAEVLNLGYPGTNSSRLLGLYPEFMEAFAPDVVLVMVGVNDFWTQPVPVGEEPEEKGWLAFVKRHSRLYKGLYILRRRSGALSLDVADEPDSSFQRGEGTIRAGGREFPVGWTTEVGVPAEVDARLRENLRRLADLSKDSAAKLVFMTYPGRFRYYGVANKAIRAVARERGIPLIDLEAVFRPICPEFRCPDWLFEDQHPKSQGYRLVAETITSELPPLLD